MSGAVPGGSTWTRWGRDLAYDLRYAARALGRARGFTAVAVLTLALGIGANVALFSVVDGVLLRPMPFPDAHQLVRVSSFSPGRNLRGSPSMPDYREFRRENQTLSALGAYTFAGYSATGGDRSELVLGLRVTGSIWSVLQARPLLGQFFADDAETWGRHQVVVISHQLWQRRFGADSGVVGRSLELDGQPYRIVAVMPDSFVFGGPAIGVWTPLAFAPGDLADSRQMFFLESLGRMKRGVTRAQAEADLARVARDLDRRFSLDGLGVVIDDWRESIVGPVRPTLLFLFGAVGFVLLIACANVANLVLARATTREHELAMRVALGAGRGRLMRQLLTEYLVLTSLGAGAGVLLAGLLVGAIPALGPIGVPRMGEVALDWRAVAFAAGMAMTTGVLFGIWPARQAGQLGVAGRVVEAARAVTGGGRGRLRRTLVTSELALSLVLLVGCALLLASLQRVEAVDPGFNPDRLFTARLTLPQTPYRDPARARRFIEKTVTEVRGVPGVDAAGITTTLPLADGDWGRLLTIDGRPAARTFSQVPAVRYRVVSPDYFRAMQVTFRRGRAFTNGDAEGAPLVAVVNETAARRFWPDGDPIGARISANPPEALVPGMFPRPDGSMRFPRLEIVGVVGDLRQNGRESDVLPEVFVPFAQSGDQPGFMHFLAVRTKGDPLAATDAIEAAVHRVDPNVPLADVRPMVQRLADSIARRRVVMLLVAGFAGVALLLAVIGVYGVMAFTVAERRAEFGLRAALGASANHLLRMAMADGVRMTAIGACVGLVLAVALSSLVTGQLFEVAPLDPAIIAGATATLALVALVACGIPAARAARVAPSEALRGE